MSTPNTDWFVRARYGLFVHYGLYSLLGRGEWVLNREQIPREEYFALAQKFTAEKFDAEYICDLAVRAGMRYINFTTMHHDGFRLYDTELSDFNSMRSCGRDLVQEIVDAARVRGLKISLYHSLNNWMDQPDAVAALEDKTAYETFIEKTFERIREVVTKFNPIDVLWYDGWWPFNAEGWQAEKMNAMVRAVQPHILFNGRNGLPGDFSTPEGHLGSPNPWRPWEACITLNNNWGFHAGDHEWKTPAQIVAMLATCAQGQGNLLLNIGPRGDGSVPEPSGRVLEQVGKWFERHGETIFDTDRFTFDLREHNNERGDFCHHGPFTARGNALYLLARCWPGREFSIGGLQCEVQRVSVVGTDQEYSFQQQGERVTVTGLPEQSPDPICAVLRFECDRPPVIHQCGGMRTPRVPHPRYDPCPSDIVH